MTADQCRILNTCCRIGGRLECPEALFHLALSREVVPAGFSADAVDLHHFCFDRGGLSIAGVMDRQFMALRPRQFYLPHGHQLR